MPSLMTTTSIVSEESLVRDTHTHAHTHRKGLVYRKNFKSHLRLWKQKLIVPLQRYVFSAGQTGSVSSDNTPPLLASYL